MTDKEKIKEEIERLDEEYRTLRVEGTTQQAKEADLVVHVLLQISNFIDSLPEESGCEVNFTTKSEDLEEYAIRYCHNLQTDELYGHHIEDAVKAGAEWQKKQIKEALQTEYEKGRFDMREEMMKDAVEAVVSQVPCMNEIIFHNPASVRWDCLPSEMNKLGIEKGDKVKLIIIKEDN